MAFSRNVTSLNPKPNLKLHLFWVCQPKAKGMKIRKWGASKEEAYKKIKEVYPDASVLWKQEL